jgi:hypothetical protein
MKVDQVQNSYFFSGPIGFVPRRVSEAEERGDGARHERAPEGDGRDVHDARSGLPDFSCFKIPKRGKINQVTTKYTQWPSNIPHGCKIFQMATKYINTSKALQIIP